MGYSNTSSSLVGDSCWDRPSLGRWAAEYPTIVAEDEPLELQLLQSPESRHHWRSHGLTR
jgi:hypothetical protein